MSKSDLAVKSKESTMEKSSEEKIFKSSVCFQKAIQDLMSEIDSKRKNDLVLLEKFKQECDEHTAKCCSLLEDALNSQYEKSNCKLQEKFQELSQNLERINALETELEEFNQAMGTLFQDLQRNLE